MRPQDAIHAGTPGKPLCAAQGAHPGEIPGAAKATRRAAAQYRATLAGLTILDPAHWARAERSEQCAKCRRVIRDGLAPQYLPRNHQGEPRQ